MVEMVWSGILEINMVENGMEVMGRYRYLHGKDIFPILFSFFSLSYSSLLFFSSFFFLLSFCLLRFFISDFSSLFLLLFFLYIVTISREEEDSF